MLENRPVNCFLNTEEWKIGMRGCGCPGSPIKDDISG